MRGRRRRRKETEKKEPISIPRCRVSLSFSPCWFPRTHPSPSAAGAALSPACARMEIGPALRVGAAAGEERERGGTTTLVEIGIALDERAIFGLLLLLFRLQLLLLRDEGNAAVDVVAVVAAERREKRIVVSQKVQKAEAKSERRKKNLKSDERLLARRRSRLSPARTRTQKKRKPKQKKEKRRGARFLHFFPPSRPHFPAGKSGER